MILSAAIVAAALVATMGLYLYFSPYHSCVRALLSADYEPADAALACLHGVERDSESAPAFGGSRAWRASPGQLVRNGEPTVRTE